MSMPLVALALAAMCALFSAAAADTAQAIGLRNHAANEARRIAVSTLDDRALGKDEGNDACPVPPERTQIGRARMQCSVCRHDHVVRADVSLEWSPVLLSGLTPARGRHALSLEALNVVGTSFPACTSPSSTP
ncbi:MAG: hypothetical protein OXB99_03930 [Acidimicrobiaceae bacterium]|nr:hypothetical protein [Acidimicrobiaceae bacterium]